ncbi:hypothetical protein IV203_004759 [Nitzschia inconspicua]|uniref:Uncharacterized protein n=1 Tax=Nitzschia inconspicua TaxID=303405 RepID=A0A9K3K8P6_9STRA|nr:hypothetical protein IV203_004759 [Nitzschia inconspicua]
MMVPTSLLKSCVVLVLTTSHVLYTNAFMKVTTPNFPPIRQLQEATSILHAIPPEIAQEVQDARNQFFLWFFGASGGAGIARSAFPRMFNQVRYIQSLKNVSPTRGGRPWLESIKYPVEGNFLTIKGYLAFSAFSRANQNANPAAVRAVFDTFAQSTDLSDPFVAQEKLDSYKEDVRRLNGALLKSKLTGYLSIASLLFLLGLADVIAFGHAKDGWFYYWTPEDGILNLPKFWI